jgi:hypothetical protein
MNTTTISKSNSNQVSLSVFEKWCIAFIFAMILFKITLSVYSHMMHYTMKHFPDLYTEHSLNKFGYTKE